MKKWMRLIFLVLLLNTSFLKASNRWLSPQDQQALQDLWEVKNSEGNTLLEFQEKLVTFIGANPVDYTLLTAYLLYTGDAEVKDFRMSVLRLRAEEITKKNVLKRKRKSLYSKCGS